MPYPLLAQKTKFLVRLFSSAGVGVCNKNNVRSVYTSGGSGNSDNYSVNRIDYSNIDVSVIYLVYTNLYLNSQFRKNMVFILEDLYGNNEFVIFHLYFIRLPNTSSFILDLIELSIYLNKYPIGYIQANIIQFHKTSGVICVFIFILLSPSKSESLKFITNDLLKKNI